MALAYIKSMVIYIVWHLELIQRIIARLVMNVKQGVNALETCLPATTWLGGAKTATP
jgi:hypothetical protein